MIDMTAVKNADPELYAAMDAELKRQQGNIELIASENIVSPRRGRTSPTNTRRACPANAITAAANLWTGRKTSRATD